MDVVSFVVNKLFDFNRISVKNGFDESFDVSLSETISEQNKQIFAYKKNKNDTSSILKISAEYIHNTVLFSVSLALPDSLVGKNLLSDQNAVTVGFRDLETDRILANRHDGNIWWRYPEFGKNLKDIPPYSQGALVCIGDLHCHIQPLCGNEFTTLIGPDGLHLSTGVLSLHSLSGAFCTITVGEEPFRTISENFIYARGMGGIKVPLRTERKLPAFADGFGWCTWDAFRGDVCEKLILQKLDEFKEKHIPVRYVIIDDGWLSVKNNALTSFEADPVKFPNGLAGCIRKMKEEYGITRVCVWHAFTGGYWQGICEDSPLFCEQKENLIRTTTGLWLPNPDPEIGFKYWDAFYTFLENSGVDFVKVDNQSSIVSNCCGYMPAVPFTKGTHEALEKAVKKHFHSDMINCMGMDMTNVLCRPLSGLSRNSDDFYPNKPGSFGHHLIQNIYNALWHGQVMHCDFDMWWSSHADATVSAVLRAISGSCVYVSDAIGASDPDILGHMYEADGHLPLFDGPALPTVDLIYTDCKKEGKLQKVWNRCGQNFVLAAFRLDDPSSAEEVTSLSVIPGIENKTYCAVNFFTNDANVVLINDSLSVNCRELPVCLYSVYPVFEDDKGKYILQGPPSLYAGAASRLAEKRYL